MADAITSDEPVLPQGVTVRAFDDPKAARAGIYSGTLEALKKRFPLENKTYRLELSNVRYTGPQEFTLAQQKHALLNDKPLHTPVSGHFRLIRKADNAVVDEKDEVVMNVPYYTDRGTIINNGSEYTVANQLRLRPGVYTRVRRSGDVETQFNVKPGTGRGFRLRMEPATGVITVNVGHANMPLYPLLKALGVSDQQMIKAWGADVAHANAVKASSVSGRSAVDKLYSAFAGYNATAQDLVSKERYLAETLPKFALDPGVTARTLGISAEGITPEVLLRASSKMFNVNRGEEKPDDRDNPGFANVFGIEDLYRERIEKDAGKLSRNIMMKIARAGSLKPVGRGAFSGWHHELLQGSGLAMPGDNSNPMALEEQMMRVTRMGEGGIGSADVVTDEARQVNPGNLNFIDVLAGPENEKIGVDARLSVHARKGSDGKLYSLFLNRQGRKEYVACDTASDSVIGFPNPDPKAERIPAMKNGRVQMVPRDEVDYFVPSMSGLFSSNVNLNPMPTSVQGGRQFYGAKFWGQYMPTVKGEVPLVDSLMSDGKMTWGEHYGRQLGTLRSPAAGTVTKVTDKGVTVTDKEGKKHFVETVTDFPFNGLTGLTYTPTVKVGDKVAADDMLAASNFVDKKTGGLAMGVNLRMAWLPYKGFSYEDAICISESAAKKLATDRLYGFEADPRDGGTLGLNKYMSAFPKKFTKEQYATLDDNGVVKEGTVLNKGDPIAVAVGPKMLTAEDANLGKLSKVLRNAFTDKAQVWDHDYPGTVVSSTVFRGRAKVNVKASPPMQVGDKMAPRFALKGVVGCYDPATEVLTSSGWKAWPEVTLSDRLAVLPDGVAGCATFARPDALHVYDYDGYLVHARTEQLDYRVTGNHRMYCRIEHYRGIKAVYRIRTADDVFGKSVVHLCAAEFAYNDVESMPFDVTRYVDYDPAHERKKAKVVFDGDDFAEFLGWYISEGNTASYSGSGVGVSSSDVRSYKVQISQSRAVKPHNCIRIEELLSRMGLRWLYHGTQYTFSSKPLYILLHSLGHANEKYLPDFVWGFSKSQLRRLFTGLMLGDGTVTRCATARDIPSYITTSPKLARQVEFLMTLLGYNVRIRVDKRAGARYSGHGGTRSSNYNFDKYTVVGKACTELGQSSATFTREQYTGKVYCATVPGGLLYVRRSGRPIWCGNSIIPDDKMPRDAVTNEPYDILMNPMGIPSRVAPGQLIETALGKLAKATGKQIRIPQDPPPEGWAQWASNQLAAAGVSPTADVFDPETGRTLHGIGDGYVYFHAMHHLADKKISAKGGFGGYTADLQPAKGGKTGAKRISGLDTYALIAHGATEVMKDVQTIRGTKNEEFWKAVRSGGPLPMPQVPFVYQKAMNLLRAGGINVVEGQKATDILPMTDADTDKLAGDRIIRNSKMLDDELKELKGGLFDPYLTGGNGNRNRWAAIALPEAVPNPVMEEPVRRLLGLTGKKLQAIIAGEEQLNGLTGGAALQKALAAVDVDAEIRRQRDIVRKSRGSVRDNAVKVLGYLSGCKKQGITPKDWMITKIPVIPTMFRPIAKVGDTALVSDINELYRDVIESSDAFSQLKGDVPDSGLTEERLNVYKAVKAAYGLGDAISPEGQAKRLKGAIRQVIGTSPKFGLFQSKVISKAVDSVGRAVISPEPNYDMDQCGIPENEAWTLYKDYVMRGLRRRGYSEERAAELIEKREPVAKDLLLEEMGRRPVILDRAPTWHKFNLMAFWPSLVPGNTLRMNPVVEKAFTADHDGDTMNFHVPASDKAVSEAIEKMLPSKNLFSTTDLRSPRYVPMMEMTLGLAKLTAPSTKAKPQVFVTARDAIRAYRRGEIGANDPVSILRM